MLPLQRAEALHRVASDLLRETGVIALLSTLRQVHTVGGYRLNVMFRTDIDLIVTTGAPSREQAIRMAKLLLDRGHFQTVGFADWFTYRKPDVSKGFYWQLITPHAGDWWKFDVWYMAPEDDVSIEAAERFEHLIEGDNEARQAILNIKAQLFDGLKYRDGVTGFDIYDAVLNYGVPSLKSFQEMRSAGPDGSPPHDATNG